MLTNKHSRIGIRKFSVLTFFLLHCLFIASPLVQAFPKIVSFSTALPIPINDNDPEESSLLNKANQKQYCQVAAPANRKLPSTAIYTNNCFRYANVSNKAYSTQLDLSMALMRPFYYSFLSNYHLF